MKWLRWLFYVVAFGPIVLMLMAVRALFTIDVGGGGFKR